MQIASAFFLVVSPILTWITIVSFVEYQNFIIFGTATQSNLLQVSSRQLGTNISDAAAVGSTLSAIALTLGALVTLKRARLGASLGAFGLAAYLVPMYQVFGGTTAGLEQTYISPGIGVFCAAVGVGLGFISPLSSKNSIHDLLAGLATRRGLSSLGVFIGSVALTLDFSNHFALGQVTYFIGAGPLEQVLHLGLVAGVASALTVAVAGVRLDRDSILFWVGLSTILLIGADSAFNIANGTLQEFLGHNLTEIFLHIGVYYGMSLVVISGFLRRVNASMESPALNEYA